MQQVIDTPECSFCHSKELELFYAKTTGLMAQCIECGYSCAATNEHLSSSSINLLAG
ncbi:MAG: hypothetical protein WCP71_05375 [Actinomycetes bacterium]